MSNFREKFGCSEIKMPGQCVFDVHWLQDEQYVLWLTSVNDKNKTRCKICLKDIDIGNMGESVLKRMQLVRNITI